MPLRRAYRESRDLRDSSVANDFAPGYDDYTDSYDEDGEFAGKVRRPAVRVSFRAGLLPKTTWGRVAAGIGGVVVLASGVAGLLAVRSFLLHDGHFVVESSAAIQIAGNSHLTRPQLLSVFGGDVERNIFRVPLADRRAELESLPWVAHATVMRLLPNQVRVAIVERTPVAFVREGSQIGLVDAHGVLLDMARPIDAAGDAAAKVDYSFPVVTGIAATDPLSTRAARVKIYMEFMAALDATGEHVSHKVSEVDVSSPEDVRAVLPDGAGNGGAGVLVHFGEDKFLERYHQYQQHLAEWRTQYPRLSSVDMRYERQVVLQMQPGAEVPDAKTETKNDAAPKPAARLAEKPVLSAAKPVAVAATPAPSGPKTVAGAQPKPATAGKGIAPAEKPATAKLTVPTATPGDEAVPKPPVPHLTKAFDVVSRPAPLRPGKPGPAAADPQGAPR